MDIVELSRICLKILSELNPIVMYSDTDTVCIRINNTSNTKELLKN